MPAPKRSEPEFNVRCTASIPRATRLLKFCSIATSLLLLAAPRGFGVLHGQMPAAADSQQTSAATPEIPKYDVASIKPSGPDSRGMMLMMTPTGMQIKGAQIQTLLQFAFGVERDRIIGAPDWVRSRHFDIEAKVKPEDAPKLQKLKMEQRRTMMLPLLEERFNLKYHHETRELPIYALVIAKGGPKLTESKPGEGMPGPDGEPPRPGDPLPPRGSAATARPDGPPGAGNRPAVGEGMRIGPGSIQSRGGSTAFLAHALSAAVGRTIIDRTGLTGAYDFSLSWTPDQSMRSSPGGAQPGQPEGDSAPDASGPSLFTAVQEQLGLKLDPQKSAVDVIVIDHIDPPTEN